MADADRPIIAEREITAPADVQAPAAAEPAAEKPKRGWLRIVALLSVPLIIIGVGAYFWLTSGRFVSTDNAYVQQDKVSVSADVGGRIVEVSVRENQHVNKGDLLFRIDPEPYRIAVEQARAALASAQVNVQTLRTEYQGKGADIEGARIAIQQAQEDFDRQSALMARGFTTRANYLNSQHALQQAKVQLQNAQAEAALAKAKLQTGAAVPGENPQIAAARAQLDQALLNLKRTEVRAPAPGTVSQADRLQVGNQIVSGLPALSIVVGDRTWVEANFKETQLNKVRVGQPAEIEIDAYSGLKLKGHVWSFGAGTGSEFSVLPAQNANGNWVKVTQRVPVRIAIDEASPRPLIAGLSADVTVDVRGQH
ncbi:biotin/lipoyl-binding protein [Sphingomonas sp. MAH-20]|uniref:Biotin/lipoyl-binding protein n=1 Tax=Sphingomonas horti TaxID=2682842 RepID=A0A6I4J2K2_9SPHN|nr:MULTISPECIES: HlyD family secretion protein [Sphingomonas]MBA2919433.1 HlyD family secretion protein [Sphingomonas sp. CGMCC 1.13658]MVO78313.1 biotin/lipoyl-binding protein [Sphingomonas horti]